MYTFLDCCYNLATNGVQKAPELQLRGFLHATWIVTSFSPIDIIAYAIGIFKYA